MSTREPESVELVVWDGPWADDDPDANFKRDVALYAKLDPMSTITNLGNATGIPPGALVRYILAKWASAGAEALMTLGPTALNRMAEAIEEAERLDSDEARLAAYATVAPQLRWMQAGLDDPTAYPGSSAS